MEKVIQTSSILINQLMRSAQSIFAAIVLALTNGSVFAQLSLIDDLGRSISLASPATRIVSLAPSITETLFALRAGKQIAGVTDYCNYPEEAKERPKVGGIVNPSVEKIISLEPDLVVMSAEGNSREDFRKLESLGRPVFVTNPRTLEGIYKSIMDLGVLSGTREDAVALIEAMKQREEAVRATSGKKVRIMLIVSLQPLILVGTGTFLAELINLAGGDNVASGTGLTYPTFSRESVVLADPEVAIAMSDLGVNRETLLSMYPEWKNISAIKDGRVFTIDSDIISRPGPRVINGLEMLQEILHSHPSSSQDE